MYLHVMSIHMVTGEASCVYSFSHLQITIAHHLNSFELVSKLFGCIAIPAHLWHVMDVRARLKPVKVAKHKVCWYIQSLLSEQALVDMP